jgi:hypothetical protein
MFATSCFTDMIRELQHRVKCIKESANTTRCDDSSMNSIEEEYDTPAHESWGNAGLRVSKQMSIRV